MPFTTRDLKKNLIVFYLKLKFIVQVFQASVLAQLCKHASKQEMWQFPVWWKGFLQIQRHKSNQANFKPMLVKCNNGNPWFPTSTVTPPAPSIACAIGWVLTGGRPVEWYAGGGRAGHGGSCCLRKGSGDQDTSTTPASPTIIFSTAATPSTRTAMV